MIAQISGFGCSQLLGRREGKGNSVIFFPARESNNILFSELEHAFCVFSPCHLPTSKISNLKQKLLLLKDCHNTTNYVTRSEVEE